MICDCRGFFRRRAFGKTVLIEDRRFDVISSGSRPVAPKRMTTLADSLSKGDRPALVCSRGGVWSPTPSDLLHRSVLVLTVSRADRTDWPTWVLMDVAGVFPSELLIDDPQDLLFILRSIEVRGELQHVLLADGLNLHVDEIPLNVLRDIIDH